MRSKTLHWISKSLLLILGSYIGLIIALTHVHIVQGNIIVHAHLQTKSNSDDDKDSQAHSEAELILLNQLSSIDMQPKLLGQVFIEPLKDQPLQLLIERPIAAPLQKLVYRAYSLRAPPCL